MRGRSRPPVTITRGATDVIFADGFETGDTSAWAVAVP